MTTFGISAFLKLICLNSGPQKTLIRSRIVSSGDAYDYHRSLRLRVNRFLVGNQPIMDVIASTDQIVKKPERQSARAGLEKLKTWRDANPGPISQYNQVTYESPSGLFKVSFRPDFGIKISNQETAVHVWNTATPPLIPKMVYTALSLFPDIYADEPNVPSDLAVLSLRNEQLFSLSKVQDHTALSILLIEQIEQVFHDVYEDLNVPPPNPGDQPSPF